MLISLITIMALSAIPNTPAIRTVRQEVSLINDAITAKKMSTEDVTGCLKNSAYFELARVTVDGKNVIRKIEFKSGTSDHLSNAAYYFNAKGKNRFNFVYLGAVNGTELERRLYFAEDGKALHEDRKLIKGEGYPGGLPSEYIPNAKDFLAKICSPDG
jgi:hypothetical protein